MPPEFSTELSTLADLIAEQVAERVAGTPPKRFLSVKAAAIYSDLGQDSLRSLLANGRLTAHRPVAGRVLIDRKELDALVLASTGRARKRRGVYPRQTKP